VYSRIADSTAVGVENCDNTNRAQKWRFAMTTDPENGGKVLITPLDDQNLALTAVNPNTDWTWVYLKRKTETVTQLWSL
jgi:hypothetical protein